MTLEWSGITISHPKTIIRTTLTTKKLKISQSICKFGCFVYPILPGNTGAKKTTKRITSRIKVSVNTTFLFLISAASHLN